MIQIYTGEGKGKTTAAIGLAVRAAGAGLKVLFIQVIKDGKSSEITVLKKIPGIKIKIFGTGEWIDPKKINTKEKQNSRQAMVFLKNNISKFQVIIVDELVTAVWLKLISEAEVLELFEDNEENLELVVTGHRASKRLVEAADLVTEMKSVKHYFKKGRAARKGIEW